MRGLMAIDPPRAREILTDTYRKNGGLITQVAKAFAVHHSTLYRWIRELDFEADLELLDQRAREEGWKHIKPGPGRPPKDPNAPPKAKAPPKPPKPRPKLTKEEREKAKRAAYKQETGKRFYDTKAGLKKEIRGIKRATKRILSKIPKEQPPE
jgi:transposase-like protein